MRFKNTFILSLFFIFSLLLGGCKTISSYMMQDHSDMHDSHMMSIAETIDGELTVVDAMSSATPPGVENGSAYMTILNGLGHPVHLVSVNSEVADMTQLHESTEKDGVMSMIHQSDGFVIEAGEALQLEPGGKHVMLMGLFEPFAADSEYSITLNFADADPIIVNVSVMAIGEMDHSSMKHSNESE